MDQTPQPKDLDWLNAYKNKSHISTVFKRPTLLLGTHTNKKNQLKYNTKDSHQTTRGENQRKREEKKSNKNKSKAINKMAIRTYISITTLNVNGLNAPAKRQTG